MLLFYVSSIFLLCFLLHFFQVFQLCSFQYVSLCVFLLRFSHVFNTSFSNFSRLFAPPHGRNRTPSLNRRLHPLRQGDRPPEEVPLQPGHGRLRESRVPIDLLRGRLRRPGSSSPDTEVPLGSEHSSPQALSLLHPAGHDTDPGLGFGLGIKLSESTGLNLLKQFIRVFGKGRGPPMQVDVLSKAKCREFESCPPPREDLKLKDKE